MSVRIHLDNSPSFYTNLDAISGRITLSLNSDENISAILVKLKGESKTALERPPGAFQHWNPSLMTEKDQRQGVSRENHKVLYKVSQVFPTKNPGSGATAGSGYKLRAGQHDYPFRFKIPFYNGCSASQSQEVAPGTKLGGLGKGGQQLQCTHVKRTLPPSLTGFPGEAEIRYYVKVTIQRPSLFKANRRWEVGFRFMPIELPKPPPSTNEVYARRPYTFQPGPAYPQTLKLVPRGEVDARLPSPAVLTCNEPVPLRIILRKLGEGSEQLYLMLLQLHLIGSTEVRAGDVVRVEPHIWNLMSTNRLVMPIGSPSDSSGTEIVVDKTLWDHIPLPNTVTPSFHICNLTRKYDLDVRIGLGYGTPGNTQLQTVIPLCFQVDVSSGISPPAALVTSMAPAYDTACSQRSGDAGDGGMDVLPSYADAIADDHEPLDGERRDFSGVTDLNAPALEKGSAPTGDLKSKLAPPPSYGQGHPSGRR